MRSKLLDAEILIKNTSLFIPNTEFDISVDWSLSISEFQDYAEVKVDCERIFGTFSYKEAKDGYKRRVEVDFECSKDWVITPIDRGKLTAWLDTKKDQRIYPTHAVLDFDNKSAKLCF